LKVLQFVPILDEHGTFGGPATVSLLIGRELSRRGHSVVFLGARHRRSRSWSGDTDGAGLEVAPGRYLFGLKKPALLLSARLIGRSLRLARWADVVHIHGARELTTFTLAIVCVLLRRPYVLQVHGMLESPDPTPGIDQVFGWLLKRSAGVGVLTEQERSAVVRRYGGTPPPQLLRNPAPVRPQAVERRPEILFCARLHPRKRVELFLDMVASLDTLLPDHVFVVLGAPEGDEAKVLAAQASHPGRLVWRGGVSQPEALEAIGSAAVLVVTAQDEPYGMTLVEAIVMGTPVVTTTDLALGVELARQSAAVVVDADGASLAHAVLSLVSDDSAVDAMAKAGRVWIADNAEIGAVVDDVLALYGEVAT
jgi:glycosyltransferase involved in cell wall biosynthesis